MQTWTLTPLAPRARTQVARLAGVLDGSAGLDLPRALAELGRPTDPVLLDVSGLPRLGLLGLRALAREEHDRAVRGGSLALQGASSHVRRELAGAGLLHLAVAPAVARAAS